MKTYFGLVILLLAALGIFTFFANFEKFFVDKEAPFETIESLTFSKASGFSSETAVIKNSNKEPDSSEIQVDTETQAGAEELAESDLELIDLASLVKSNTFVDSSSTNKAITTDTSSKKQSEFILLFGDSMAEGLRLRLDDYAEFNGHKLVSIIRYSSTTVRWAEVDNLKTFLEKNHPTFIIVSLGSNEMFVKNLKKAESAIEKLMTWFGETPFIWIGPPNWKKDTGINDLVRKKIGADRFFESRNLTFQRGPDHVHPTYASCEKWMDKVIEWMNSDLSSARIKMEKPSKKGRRKSILKIWKQKIP